MQRNALVLFPQDAYLRLDSQQLLAVLGPLGLTGERLATGAERYRVGPRFLNLVSFLGCSPHIRLEPAEGVDAGSADGAFCYLQLVLPDDAPAFIGGDNVVAPRCPRCQGPLSEWRAALAGWQKDKSRYRLDCPACGARTAPAAMSWRRRAAVASTAIFVWDIHEAEAVPTDMLMTALSDAAGCAWDYFYLAQSDRDGRQQQTLATP